MAKNGPKDKKPRLELHIPEPKCRPGKHADFSGLPIPPAGKVARPAFDTP